MRPEEAILHVVIPGVCPPAPRPRARVVGKGKQAFASVYTPAKGPYATWKRAAQTILERAVRGTPNPAHWPAKSDPLQVRLLFVMPLPEAAHRKTIHIPRHWCTSHGRGDIDNLAKGPLDAANGILWADDRDVASMQAEKVIGEQGEPARVEMLVARMPRAGSHRTRFEAIRDEVWGSDRVVGCQHKEVAVWQPQPEPLPLFTA